MGIWGRAPTPHYFHKELRGQGLDEGGLIKSCEERSYGVKGEACLRGENETHHRVTG